MRLFLIILATILWLGDTARAQSFRLSQPLNYGSDLHYTETRDASASRDPLKRVIADLSRSPTVTIERAWTYAELAGAQTTCGEIILNGRHQKFVLQQGPKTAVIGPAMPTEFWSLDVQDYQFRNAGCLRDRAAQIIPPRF
ncbi:hypothetical protein D869_gp180 [Caulobacter phage CcrRogue]|uniref:Uncharacterized protein n=1 Tax=Caulobacter phage CcrRogue TaxID=2927986 RepID=K4JND0_9CAUD|nr:hypothetical protein D869_gp180 [Caulobacter phage CcrRogue]AFU86734.1 hypothetical protein CcrRogue_gp252 [Caulobacter phage CcrRogue]